jgi:hypothetical protein
MGKLLLTVGLAGLFHAAYSATQHRSYLRLTEREFTQLPLDILFQTLISLFVCCISVIQISTKFRSINIASEWESKNWDNICNRTSFYSFNHRGKYLYSTSPEFLNQSLSANNTADSPSNLKQILNERVNNSLLKNRDLSKHLETDSSLASNEETDSE